MNSIFGNWQTTLIGVIAAMANYFVNLGTALPTTGKEWGIAMFSAFLAGIGILAKDASTGSKAL